MKYLVLGFTALFLALCSKEVGTVQSEMDYLIFGHYYGHCGGEECVEIFKLTDDMLFEDVADTYNATEFDFSPLGNEKFEIAQVLYQTLPAQLLNSTESTFGCPDCADQGGLYIEIATNDESRSWRIDQNERMVPGYLHDFVNKVNRVIAEINHP